MKQNILYKTKYSSFLQIIDRKKIKFLQETWFKRDKESRLNHVFYW